MWEMKGNWKGSLAQGAVVEGLDGLVMMLWTWPWPWLWESGNLIFLSDSWVEKCRAVAVDIGDSSGKWLCSEGEAIGLGKGCMALGLGLLCGHSPPLCLKVSPWSGEGKGLLPRASGVALPPSMAPSHPALLGSSSHCPPSLGPLQGQPSRLSSSKMEFPILKDPHLYPLLFLSRP